MPNIRAKIDWIFQCGENGWSETFYLNQTSINDALVQGSGDMRLKRLNILNTNCYLTEVRVSDDQVFRDSLVKSYSFADAQGRYLFPGAPIPAMYNALVCRVEGTSLHRRTWDLRGIPAQIVSGQGYYTPTGVWTTYFNQWRQQMIDGAAQIRLQNSTPIPPAAPANILTAIPAVGNPRAIDFTIDIAPLPAAFAAGNTVRIRGCNTLSPCNGVWRIQQIVGGNHIITYPKRIPIQGVYIPGATCRAITIALQGFTSIVPERGSSRDTGRPLGVRPGRRRRSS